MNNPNEPRSAEMIRTSLKYCVLEKGHAYNENTLHVCDSDAERNVLTQKLIFGNAACGLDEHNAWAGFAEELRDSGSLEFEGDPGLEWFTAHMEPAIRTAEKPPSDAAGNATLLQDCEITLGLNMLELEKCKSSLKSIHEIAYEKCRTGEDDGNYATIEATSREALGLKADDGFEVNKPAAPSSDALAVAIEALESIEAELTKGNSAITDTVWMSDTPNETMLERVEHTLATLAQANGKDASNTASTPHSA